MKPTFSLLCSVIVAVGSLHSLGAQCGECGESTSYQLTFTATVSGTVTWEVAGETVTLTGGTLEFDSGSGTYSPDTYEVVTATRIVTTPLGGGFSSAVIFLDDNKSASYGIEDFTAPAPRVDVEIPRSECLYLYVKEERESDYTFDLFGRAEFYNDGDFRRAGLDYLPVVGLLGEEPDVLSSPNGVQPNAAEDQPKTLDFHVPDAMPNQSGGAQSQSFSTQFSPSSLATNAVSVDPDSLLIPYTPPSAPVEQEHREDVLPAFEIAPTELGGSAFVSRTFRPVPQGPLATDSLEVSAVVAPSQFQAVDQAVEDSAITAFSSGSAPYCPGFSFELTLGRGNGLLRYSVDDFTSSVISPGSLFLIGAQPLETITDGSGLRQMILEDWVINITSDVDDLNIDLYPIVQLGSFDSQTGVYQLTGSHQVRWNVHTPTQGSYTTVEIIETQDAHTGTPDSEVTTVTWEPATQGHDGAITLGRFGGYDNERREFEVIDANERRETVTRWRNTDAVTYRAEEIYRNYYNWGENGEVYEELVSLIEDPDGVAPMTTTWNYFDTTTLAPRLLSSQVNPNGDWEAYEYYTNAASSLIRGEVSAVFSSYQNTSFPLAIGSLFHYELYTPSAFTEGSANFLQWGWSRSWRQADGSSDGAPIVTVGSGADQETVGGAILYRTQPAFVERFFVNVNASDFHFSDLVRGGQGSDLILSRTFEDNSTEEIYQQSGDWNPTSKTFTVSGSGNEAAVREIRYEGNNTLSGLTHGRLNETLIHIEVRSPDGRVFQRQAFVYDDFAPTDANPTNVDSRTDPIETITHEYDADDYLVSTTLNGIVVYQAHYANDELQWEEDDEGIRTTYTHHPDGSIHTGTKAVDGETTVTTYTYTVWGDIETVAIASAGETLTTTYTYDLARRLTSVTDHNGLVTTTSYRYETNPSAGYYREVTVTYPGGATEITRYRRDGSIFSVTGTALEDRFYTWGYATGGVRLEREFLDSALTERTTQSVLDWRGRVIQQNFATFEDDGTFTRNFFYDSNFGSGIATGQLRLITEPNRWNEWIEYGDFGRIEARGFDANNDGFLTDNSVDPLTRFTLQYTVDAGETFQVDTRTEFLDYDSLAGTSRSLVTTIREQLTGRPADTRRIVEIDPPSGRTQTFIETVDQTAQQTTQELGLVGSSASKTIISQDNRLISESRWATSQAVTFDYDGLGRLEAIADPNAGDTVFSYFAGSTRIETITDPLNRDSTFAYYSPTAAQAGRIFSRTNPDTSVIYFDHDNRGNLTHRWGTGAYPVRMTYDDAGRLQTLRTWANSSLDFTGITFPGGSDSTASLTEWVYDPFTSLLQHKRFDDYDDLTNPTAQLTFDYRDNGFLLTRTDQRGVVTTYTPDSLQRLQSIAYSDGTPTVALTYNRSSRRLTQSDASGSRNFTYTDAGLLDTEVYTSGSLAGFTIDHNYAANDDYGGVELHDGGTSIYLASADYDAFDRARTITFGSDTFTYNYDPTNGRLDSITIAPNGTPRFEHDYTFDTYGRLTGLAFEQGGTTHSNWQYTTFDAMDRRTAVINSDRDTWSYGYNLRGELDDAEKRTGITTDVVPGYRWGYEYDDIGNRDTVRRNGREDVYTPNALNQYDEIALAPFTTILGESSADISLNGTAAQTDGVHFAVEGEFTDSPSPELATFTLTGTLTGAGDDGLDAVADFEVEAFYPGNTFTPQYDAAGNLTSNGQWIFAYNGENRLIHAWTLPVAVAAGVTPQRISFNYDGEGRRFTKTVYALVGDPAAYVGISPTSDTWTITESRRFIYDGWNLIVELDDADSIIQSYLWGMDISGTWQGAGGVGGLLAIQEPSDNLLFPAFDGNGNVTALIDESTNSVVAEYEYSPFGELLRATGSKAEANPFGFSTKYFDDETKLYAYIFRYYASETGRWLNRDPLGEHGGSNLYRFGPNSPTNGYDVLGRQWMNEAEAFNWAAEQDGFARNFGSETERTDFVQPEVDVTISPNIPENLYVFQEDIRGAVDLQDALNRTKGILHREGACLKTLTLVGHGSTRDSEWRGVTPVGTEGSKSYKIKKGKTARDIDGTNGYSENDTLRGELDLFSDEASGTPSGSTTEFFRGLQNRFCNKCEIIFYSCNTGRGERGRAFLQQIANQTGCSVKGYQGSVATIGITITPSITVHPQNRRP